MLADRHFPIRGMLVGAMVQREIGSLQSFLIRCTQGTLHHWQGVQKETIVELSAFKDYMHFLACVYLHIHV